MSEPADDESGSLATNEIQLSQAIAYVVLGAPSQMRTSQQISYVVLAPVVPSTVRQYAVTVIG